MFTVSGDAEPDAVSSPSSLVTSTVLASNGFACRGDVKSSATAARVLEAKVLREAGLDGFNIREELASQATAARVFSATALYGGGVSGCKSASGVEPKAT